MTIFFTADMHFGHTNIIDYCNRPFHSVSQMNDEMISNWNNVVDDTDTVYVLGDVAMGKVDENLPLAKKLKGFKILLPGNHDRCWHGGKKDHADWIERYEEAHLHVIRNGYVANWCDDSGNVVADLCHFPFAGDSGMTDRFSAHRPNNNGQWLLHGHVHDKWTLNEKMINVGVDVWDYTPVSLDWILAIKENYEAGYSQR